MSNKKLLLHQAQMSKLKYDELAKSNKLLSRKERRLLSKSLDVEFNPIPYFKHHEDPRWKVRKTPMLKGNRK